MKRKFILFKFARLLLSLTILLLIAGCMYPNSERRENQVLPSESIFLVQHAVDEYHQATGVLPIKNSTMETPIYEKYPVHFKQLIQHNVLSTIPANAFENGGTNYYVLIHAEQDPEVKLLDLITMQKAADIKREVEAYQANHAQELPLGESVSTGFHRLDFNKMGLKVQQVRSVYSDQYLSFLIHDSGEIVVDYAPEIMKVLTKLKITSPDPKTDLRSYLVSESFYVPAKSFPYYWVNGQPQIATK